jgi:rhodanese-related sulfurtransferase
MGLGTYAGDVEVEEVWEQLKADPRILLVDVRTRAEWSFVGLPDLRSVGGQPALVEWQTFPAMAVNSAFVDSLRGELERRGLAADTPLYFLCRSGARSRSAAVAATEAGLGPAYNVAGGFEGPVGPDGHRGSIRGWKAAGLPWVQS